LTSTGLDAGSAAKLAASLGALNSGGSTQVSLPTIATDTNNRVALTSLVSGLMGSAKIEPPKYSGNAATFGQTPDSIKKIDDRKKEIADLEDTLYKKMKAMNDASAAYQDAANSKPNGDPSIAAFLTARNNAKSEVDAVTTQINELRAKPL
jgi:hypothetical protein